LKIYLIYIFCSIYSEPEVDVDVTSIDDPKSLPYDERKVVSKFV